jgi:hypothetical protein
MLSATFFGYMVNIQITFRRQVVLDEPSKELGFDEAEH